MVTVVVWETWFVGATTARNLVGISIRVTTVVTTPQSQKKEASDLSYLSLCHLQLIRDARGVTMMVGVGAAPLKNPVVRERVTVMDMVGGIPMFRRSYIPKVLCSELFRKSSEYRIFGT